MVVASHAAGATWTQWEEGGKHIKLHLSLDGGRTTRFVTMSRTASDHRAVKNIERDIKRVIRELA